MILHGCVGLSESCLLPNIISTKVSKGAKIRNRYNQVPDTKVSCEFILKSLLYRGISFIAAFAYHMNFRVQRHLAIVYIQHIGG